MRGRIPSADRKQRVRMNAGLLLRYNGTEVRFSHYAMMTDSVRLVWYHGDRKEGEVSVQQVYSMFSLQLPA